MTVSTVHTFFEHVSTVSRFAGMWRLVNDCLRSQCAGWGHEKLSNSPHRAYLKTNSQFMSVLTCQFARSSLNISASLKLTYWNEWCFVKKGLIAVVRTCARADIIKVLWLLFWSMTSRYCVGWRSLLACIAEIFWCCWRFFGLEVENWIKSSCSSFYHACILLRKCGVRLKVIILFWTMFLQLHDMCMFITTHLFDVP